MRILLLGAVTKAHGLRGQVQILPFHADSPRWEPGETLHLVPAGLVSRERSRREDVVEVDEARPVRLEGVHPAPKDRLVARLEGVRFRDQAEALVGALLGVLPEDLEDDLGDGEYWYFEVPGWEVVDLAGEAIGTIVRAIPAHTDLFEVRPVGGGPTFFVPVVDQVVSSIDRARGRVVVDPIEGLIP
ncbi:MAG: ribosome maturation factor RimM [Myxococcota bacterium]